VLVVDGVAREARPHLASARVLVFDRRALVADSLAGALASLGLDATSRRAELGNDRRVRIPPGTTCIVVGAGFPWSQLAPWLRRLRLAGGGPSVLLLLDGEPPTSSRVALSTGLRGWIDAHAPLAELVAALDAVHAGRAWFPRPRAAGVRDGNRLTSREREVLRHLAEGKPDAVIARVMNVSPHTVRTHVQNVRAKLGVPNRFAAVTVARRERLLPGTGTGG
jgi:DNA-binding NarL/FixJ family response regulator